MNVADLAEWVRRAAIGPERFILGLVGPPGSGKTTVASQLSTELDAPVAPMDGYHLTNDVLDERGLQSVKGAPHTFDDAGFATMLRSLRHGGDVRLPDFDRTVDEPRPDRIAIPGDAPIVIVEGNYLLTWESVTELLDVVGYIDVDPEVRVQRLIARHIEFGRSSDVAIAFAHGSDARNTEIIESARHRADLTIRAR